MTTSFSLRDLLRTPPHIVNLKFSILLVIQYQSKKESLERGKQEGWDRTAEEYFLEARQWQYEKAVKELTEASVEHWAEALKGMKIGRSTRACLKAAGLDPKFAQARVLSATRG